MTRDGVPDADVPDGSARSGSASTFRGLGATQALAAIEQAYGLALDGTLTEYASYVNRVYGIRDDGGREYVAKFYRPGRWDQAALVDEHRMVADCVAAELPVVAPLARADGATLSEVVLGDQDDGDAGDAVGKAGTSGQGIRFACYPKRAGRTFDGDSDEDWFRIGGLIGRLHAAARHGSASNRLVCTPDGSTRSFVRQLRHAGVVTAAQAAEFFDLAERSLALLAPLFEGAPHIRLHGDCHRGNILDRPGEGLLLIDFDDMMRGPAVQDLWLLLPGRLDECSRELGLVLEGYEQFSDFDYAQLRLVEPLRLMRMVYFLAWSASQREDPRFRVANPHWGSEAFWLQEIEDLRTQLEIAAQAD